MGGEVLSLSSAVFSVTNCVFPCHFKTDMTQSNSELVTDDQFPILEYKLSKDPYLLLSGWNPLKLKTVEQLCLNVSCHPGHWPPDRTTHTSIMPCHQLTGNNNYYQDRVYN